MATGLICTFSQVTHHTATNNIQLKTSTISNSNT